MRVFIPLLLSFFSALAEIDGRVEYVGGTLQLVKNGSQGIIKTTHTATLIVEVGRSIVQVPYSQINLLEYGQHVNRRLALAIVVSPLFLLSKAKRHFLTVGYQDGESKQQAMVLRVGKGDVRAVLASLEARTGLKIQYQDENARKAGRG